MITLEEWQKKAKIGVKFYAVNCFTCDPQFRNSVEEYTINGTRYGTANYGLCLVPHDKGGFATVLCDVSDGISRLMPLFREQCFWTEEEAEAFARKQEKEEVKSQIVRIKTELNKAQKKLDALEKKES